MVGTRTLVWLASYPKSGNTWLRAFLANYLLETDNHAGFEPIQRISSGDCSGASYREIAGREPGTLLPQAYVQVRHRHLSRIAQNGSEVNFVKTHASNTKLAGAPLIPPELTRQAVYIVRHPLDVLVSYADHRGITLEEASRQMADPRTMFGASAKTAAQYIGDWSGNVKSWTTSRVFSVLALRYEDMHADPDAAFRRVLGHIGLPVDDAILANAIEKSSFKALASLEAQAGFSERGPRQERFFRSGKVGTWCDVVPSDLAERVQTAHQRTMQKFGYTL